MFGEWSQSIILDLATVMVLLKKCVQLAIYIKYSKSKNVGWL